MFDDRFHLLVLKERKVAFEEFIATRAEEEMREKKQKMKERKESFMRLLQEPKITKKCVLGVTGGRGIVLRVIDQKVYCGCF